MEIAQNPSVKVDFGSRQNSKEGTLKNCLFDETITKNGHLNGVGRIYQRPTRNVSNWTNLCIKEGFSSRNKRGRKSNCTEDERDAGKSQKLVMPGDRSMTNGEVHKDAEAEASDDKLLNGGVTFISDETTCKFSQHIKISNIRAVTRSKRKHYSRESHLGDNGIEAQSEEDFVRNNVNGIKRSDHSKTSVVNNHVHINSKGDSGTESNCGFEVPISRSNVTRLKRTRKDGSRNGDCRVNGTCVTIETIRDNKTPNQEGAHPNKGKFHHISTCVERVEKPNIAGDQTSVASERETLLKNNGPSTSSTTDDNCNGGHEKKGTAKTFVNTIATNFKPVRLKRKRITKDVCTNNTDPESFNHGNKTDNKDIVMTPCKTDNKDVVTTPCNATSSGSHKNNSVDKATTNSDIRLNNDEIESNECDTNKLKIPNSEGGATVKINGIKHHLNRQTVINGTKVSCTSRRKIVNGKGVIIDPCGTEVKENGLILDKRAETSKTARRSSSGTVISNAEEAVLHCDDESRVGDWRDTGVKRSGPSLDPCGTSSKMPDIDGNHKVSIDKFEERTGEVDSTAQCYCKWINCHEKLKDALELKQHVKELHVKGMVGSDLFFCFWKGCKVYNKPSSSYKWLVKHVNFHVGVRPFQCVIEPCQLSFASQNALIRHVQSHFNHRSKYYKKSEDVSKEANVTPGKDEEVNSGSESSCRKEMKNRRLKLFMRRRRPAASCQNDDPFDRTSMDYIKKKLLGFEKDSVDTCKPTETSFWRNGQVLGKRTSTSGKSQYLVEDPSRGHGTWLDETVVQNNDSKQMSIFKLSKDKKNELCNKIFGHSKRPRGRKRR